MACKPPSPRIYESVSVCFSGGKDGARGADESVGVVVEEGYCVPEDIAQVRLDQETSLARCELCHSSDQLPVQIISDATWPTLGCVQMDKRFGLTGSRKHTFWWVAEIWARVVQDCPDGGTYRRTSCSRVVQCPRKY